MNTRIAIHRGRWLLLAGLLVTTAIYWPGLSGSWLFDDYPNIVQNLGVQPTDATVSSLVRAALSSPASEFKRPLASLSFSANYLAAGLNPFSWKLTNLLIHLLNGWLVFLLARALLRLSPNETGGPGSSRRPDVAGQPDLHEQPHVAGQDALVGAHLVRDGASQKMGINAKASRTRCAPTNACAETAADPGMDAGTKHTASARAGVVAALIAAGWMLLPINLTGVLYVVQRMESMANLFVLLGLLGYVAGRRRMLDASTSTPTDSKISRFRASAGQTETTKLPPEHAEKKTAHLKSTSTIGNLIPPAGLFASPVRGGWLARSRAFVNHHDGFILCVISVTIPTMLGVLAKETAVMLPLYALLVEWALFRFHRSTCANDSARNGIADADDQALKVEQHLSSDDALDESPIVGEPTLTSGSASKSIAAEAAPTRVRRPRWAERFDLRIIALFLIVLVLPMAAGLAWLLPGLLEPQTWATRDFTLGTRLLSEARIVTDYIGWTLLPMPDALSFYHDDFTISTRLLTPWTTITSIGFLTALLALMFWLRPRRPLAALGIALFFGCQLLTGTILPLELIYEHRNYFASFGLLLALVPLLAEPSRANLAVGAHPVREALRTPSNKAPRATKGSPLRRECAAVVGRASASMPFASDQKTTATNVAPEDGEVCNGQIPLVWKHQPLPWALPRYALLVSLMLCWATLTALTAYAWGDPLRLAEDLAFRAPDSPRAQYELGRTYIIYSQYDPASPFTTLAYAPLEAAALLPKSSILPQQALIFMNSRMHLPLKDAWWDSIITKLAARRPGVQDESSLAALAKCASEQQCNLPHDRMVQAFTAALAHPKPNARLLATYGDYAWNVLNDHVLGEQMIEKATTASPDEPAYQITLIRMLSAQGRNTEAREALKQLETLNYGGRLDKSLAELHALPNMQ
ncbi:MAG: hypothetical protein ABI114_11190 [Rhodanobacter sp.]